MKQKSLENKLSAKKKRALYVDYRRLLFKTRQKVFFVRKCKRHT